MQSISIKTSDVERAIEPLTEVPYHQAIGQRLGLPLRDPKEQLQSSIDGLVSAGVVPDRFSELLAESRQKLALVMAGESEISDELERESLRKKKQIFLKQIDIYGRDAAERDKRQADHLSYLHKELDALGTSESTTCGSIEACSHYHGQLITHRLSQRFGLCAVSVEISPGTISNGVARRFCWRGTRRNHPRAKARDWLGGPSELTYSIGLLC